MAHRVHVFDMTHWDGQEEWVYLVRVGAFEPAGTVDLAAEDVVDVRWMTLDEIRALPTEGDGRLAAGAADHLADLVAHGHPTNPVELDF